MSSDTSSPKTDPADSAVSRGESHGESEYPWGAKRPRRWYWILLAVCVALIFWSQREEFFDHGFGNVITLIAGFLATASLAFWFSFRSAYPKPLRMSLAALVVVLVCAVALVFRIEHVSGEMGPRLALRWSRAPDELLEKAKVEVAKPDRELFVPGEHDFAQFLGPTRSAEVDGVALARDWHAAPPQLVWKRPIGAGWSAFAVVGRAAVTMEQRGEEELVTCYDLTTGKLLWSHAIQARHFETLGGPGPRATPTISEGRVYALGATGVLRCLTLEDGRELWLHNVTEEYGLTHEEDMTLVAWGRSASPLVEGDLVVVPAGGRADGPHASLVAYEKLSGRKVWQGGEHQIGYASPSVAELCGVRQILIVNEDTVSSHDPTNGRQLWEFPWPGSSTSSANTSQAVVVPGDRVFISKAYGGGSALYQIARGHDGHWSAQKLWQDWNVMKTKFTNVAIAEGYVYGLSDGVLECIALDTGKRQWKRGRYGHGQVLLVGDVLIVVAESGEAALVNATPKRYEELGLFPAIEGKTWNNPALSGPFLLVRNAEEAACFKLPVK